MQISRALSHTLVLANGRRWVVTARDEQATRIVSQLGAAMRMKVAADLPGPFDQGMRCLNVQVDACRHDASPGQDAYRAAFRKGKDGSIGCLLRPYDDIDALYVHLSELAAVVARDAQSGGGVLIHGALAEYHGGGVILAAPGGTGKSTASNRLPSPWKSLCDDTTLVLPDRQGNCFAHPWPTWSRFMGGGSGSWDVQRAVPLRAIFFLKQAPEDRAGRVGKGQAAALLAEFSLQASHIMTRGLAREETRALHLERFDNVNALVRRVPAYILEISLKGPFWKEMETALQD